MKNNSNGIESPTQGVADSSNVPDLENISKWLKRDLKACISFLNAIDQDVDLQRQMAIWFEGRISNHKNKPDPSQINIFNK